MFEQFEKVVQNTDKSQASLSADLLTDAFNTIIQSEKQRMLGAAVGFLPDLQIDTDQDLANVCSDCATNKAQPNCPGGTYA